MFTPEMENIQTEWSQKKYSDRKITVSKTFLLNFLCINCNANEKKGSRSLRVSTKVSTFLTTADLVKKNTLIKFLLQNTQLKKWGNK